MVEHTLGKLRAEGTLDSEGIFTLDPAARDRKLNIDAKKKRELEVERFERIKSIPPFDIKDEDYALWKKYWWIIAYKLATRWGVVAAAFMAMIYYPLSYIVDFSSVTVMGMRVSRMISDPIFLGLHTTLIVAYFSAFFIYLRKPYVAISCGIAGPVAIYSVVYPFLRLFSTSGFLPLVPTTLVMVLIGLAAMVFDHKCQGFYGLLFKLVDFLLDFLRTDISRMYLRVNQAFFDWLFVRRY